MEKWIIILLLSSLFVAGLFASGNFRETFFGRFILTRVQPMVGWALHRPWRTFPFVLINNLVVLIMVSSASLIPGGALWLAPLFGVHSGLIGASLHRRHLSTQLWRIPLYFFIPMFVIVLILEGGFIAFAGVWSTVQSMDGPPDLFHPAGMLLVLGPIGLIILVFCGLIETLLIWSEPRIAGPTEQEEV